MTNQHPTSSKRLTPLFCENPECRALLGLLNYLGELVICSVIVPRGALVWCLACMWLTEVSHAESGGN
jgi:hypothetical protein